MNPGNVLGSSSISFSRPVYIESAASVVGKKEGEGPLRKKFDKICRDPMFGMETWEEAESSLQKETASLAIQKAGLKITDIRMVFAGDLLAQTIASSFGIADLGLPYYGLYGACSTMGEALSLGSMAVAAGYGEHILCATSSHFATAEKEFRYPLSYGNQRPLSATWTVTGSRSLRHRSPAPPEEKRLSSIQSKDGFAVITGITTGRIVDFGLRDSLNYGRLYGSCGLRYDLPESPGFLPYGFGL